MSEFRTALEQLMAGTLGADEARARIATAAANEPHVAGAMLAVIESYRAAGRLSAEVAAGLQQMVRQAAAGASAASAAESDPTRVTANVPGGPPPIPPQVSSPVTPPVQPPAIPQPSVPPPSVPPPSVPPPSAPPPSVPRTGGTTASAPLTPGSVLKDRFVLESLVAGGDKGGMGVVFKALDRIKQEAQDRNPHVAIKLLNEDFKQHPDSMMALQREARRAQTLAHPNIITVYDFDRDGNTFFMAMELLTGSPLDKVIRENREKGGLPVAEAMKIIVQLARGLSHAHANHIVHSDFKPGNAFLTNEGVVKVLDFGIARAVQQPGSEKTRFDAGTLGAMTLPYASCEQFERQDPDPSDDVYALAIVSYELLTGRHPFERQDPDNPTRLIRTDAIAARSAKMKPQPAPIPGLTSQQWRTLQKGLAFRRQDRLRNAGEFLEGLTPSRKPVKTLLVAGLATALLLVTGGMQLKTYMQHARLQALTQRLQSSDPAVIATALRDLQHYPPEERAPVLLNDGVEASLLNYYTARARGLFDPEAGHYDYAGAMASLKEAQSLSRAYEDSRQLNDATDRLEMSRKAAIARAADAFESELSQGLLIASQGPQNVRTTLALIRELDPQHPLLSDRRLPLAFATQVRSNLDAGHVGIATALLSAGLQFAPKDMGLLDLQDRIGHQQGASQASAAAQQSEPPTPTPADATQLRARVEQELAAAKTDDASVDTLQRDLQRLAGVAGESDQGVADARRRAAQTLLTSSKDMLTSQRFSEAQHDLDLARRFDLPAESYQSQAASITEARAQRDTDDRARASSAELAAAKQRVMDQALADHIDVAQTQFAQLQRKLPPNDPFVTTDAPKAIADAYLVRARRSASQGRFDDANGQAQSAQNAAPGNAGIAAQVQRFHSARELAHQLETLDDFSTLRPQLDPLREAERAEGYHSLQAGLRHVVADRLTRLEAQDPARAARLRPTAESMFPNVGHEQRNAEQQNVGTAAQAAGAPAENEQTVAQSSQQQPTEPPPTQPPSPMQTAPTAQTGTQSAPPASAPAITAGRRAPAAAGAPVAGAAPMASVPVAVAACSEVGMSASAGTACRDDLGKAGRGPLMMVIPAGWGSAVFAMMRDEASVADYNAYCASVSGCTRASGDNPDLPVATVSESDAEKYAAWLSSATGAKYRLPTESEWKRAAGTEQNKATNCVVSGTAGRGESLRPVSGGGAPNEFGLRDITGNVQEWAKPANGGLKALGGAIGDPVELCQTAFSRPHSGQPDGRTGFRLLREIH